MIRKPLYFVAVTWFIVNLFISSIFFFSFNRGYYSKMYHRLEVAQTIGISEEELNLATDVLLDYIRDDRKTLDLSVSVRGHEVEMFNQREKDHMIDVKNLYLFADKVRIVGSIFIAIMILFSIGVGDSVKLKMSRNILRASLIFLGLVVLYLGSYAILDFESFWISFHKTLFRNDLWLLDPRTDRLIMMVPYEFFLGLVMRIVAAISVIVAGCLGVYVWLNKVVKKNDSRSTL